MHGFFYFATGIREPHPKCDALARWGLGYVFADNRIDRRGVLGAGPNGQHGVIFSLPGRGDLGFYPDKQTWRKIPPALLAEDAPELWIGLDNRAKLTPDDLARETQLAGHPVKLADGQQWQCPAAIAIDADDTAHAMPPRACVLPRRSRLDEAGQWQRDALRSEYEKLWQIAQQYWLDFHGAAAGMGEDEGAMQFDFASAHEAAVQCLAVNYRLGPVECDLLGLLDETLLGSILQAAIDWPTYRRWLQKKSAPAPAGSSSSPGPAD